MGRCSGSSCSLLQMLPLLIPILLLLRLLCLHAPDCALSVVKLALQLCYLFNILLTICQTRCGCFCCLRSSCFVLLTEIQQFSDQR